MPIFFKLNSIEVVTATQVCTVIDGPASPVQPWTTAQPDGVIGHVLVRGVVQPVKLDHWLLFDEDSEIRSVMPDHLFQHNYHPARC